MTRALAVAAVVALAIAAGVFAYIDHYDRKQARCLAIAAKLYQAIPFGAMISAAQKNCRWGPH